MLVANRGAQEASGRAVEARTRLFVFGPRTRLAASLLRSPWAREQSLVLIARNAREREWAESTYADTASAVAGELELPGEPQPAGLAIAGCALGPVHPEAPTLAVDMDAVTRDVGMVETILAAYPETPATIVVGSSRVDLQACKLEYSIVSPK